MTFALLADHSNVPELGVVLARALVGVGVPVAQMPTSLFAGFCGASVVMLASQGVPELELSELVDDMLLIDELLTELLLSELLLEELLLDELLLDELLLEELLDELDGLPVVKPVKATISEGWKSRTTPACSTATARAALADGTSTTFETAPNADVSY